ncbi:TSN3 protein, partial [Alectura lathami]|nr:TSN3 protein [Alectura lathami]
NFACFLLMFFSVLFLGSAALLAFGGGFVILTCKNYDYLLQESFFPLPGWLAVLVAFVLLPTGILAFSISVRSSRYHQGALMHLLLVLLCLQVSLAVLTHFYSIWMAAELKSTMGQVFYQYNGTYSVASGSRPVDVLQEKLECCGIQNYTDWLNASGASWNFKPEKAQVPRSCCKEEYSGCRGDLHQLEQLFQEGCLRKLQDQLWFGMEFLFCCCLVLSVLELLAAASNGILMRQRPFHDFRFL